MHTLKSLVKTEKCNSKLEILKSNGVGTHNHLVRKRTLDHLAKLVTG